MSGLLLCGKRTTNPYIIRETGTNIYSLEELCYYLYNNTYMVSSEFFSKELVKFLETELEHPSLAQKLKYHIDHKADISTMVLEVLKSSAYYAPDEFRNIEKSLEALGSKSKSERMKAMADMLLERKKYISASNAYKDILNSREEVYEPAFVAGIWNNIGVIYTKQFLFKDAVACFRTACDIDRQEGYFDNLVCAAIFSRDDELLEDITVQYEISDEDMDHYLKAIESNRKLLIKSREYMELRERLLYDGSRELSEYKEDIQKILDMWKDEYRQESR